MDLLRDRGFRGGRIAPHRSMIGLEVSKWLLIDLLVLPLMFTLAVFVFLDPLMDSWRWILDALRGPLGLPGVVATRVVELGLAAQRHGRHVLEQSRLVQQHERCA